MSTHEEIAAVRALLESAEGSMADMLSTIRVRMEYALQCIDADRPDMAREVISADIETLRGGWLGGDVGGSA